MVWTADAFLRKRYEAGFKVGYAEGRAKVRDKVRKFIAENPDATPAQIRDFLLESRESRRRNKRKGAAA